MKNAFAFLLVSSLVLLLLLPGCSESKRVNIGADSTADSTAQLRKAIGADKKAQMLDTFFKARFNTGNFSGSVLIAQRGVILYQQTFGVRTRRKNDSLTDTSSFQLASVSKQFTAAAIMLLHQQGKLNYSDTLQKFFPGFPYRGITVRQLLTHRSGLSNYIYFMDEYYKERDSFPKTISNSDVVAFMLKHRPPPYHTPDTKFDYNNTNYCLLAAIVEEISGKTFPDFMRESFFKPLQMNHTWIAGDTTAHADPPKAYYGAWKEWEPNYLDGATGDKGVYTTAADLYKWDQALYRNFPLEQNTLAEAFTPASPERKGPKNYGYGWRTLQWPDGRKSVFHNGWWHGYTTTFYRGLDDHTTIIILCNKFNRSIYNLHPLLLLVNGASPYGEEETDDAADAAPTP